MTRTWFLPMAACICISSVPAMAQSVNDPIATTDVPASTPAPSTEATPAPVAQPPAPVETCKLKIVGASDKKAGDLFALCSAGALRIGPSTGFASSYNPTLGRYLIVSQTDTGQRVFMLRPATDANPPLLEELTNELAAQARGLRAIQVRGLAGDIDISGFAASGAVRLTGDASDKPLAKASQPKAIRIASDNGVVRSIAPQVAPADDSKD